MLNPCDINDLHEFYINVDVRNPKCEDGAYMSYEIVIETNHVSFSMAHSAVRRRYSDFMTLRKLLSKEFPAIRIPDLPARYPFRDHFNPPFVERRRKGLEDFLRMLLTYKLVLSSKALHLFLQSSYSMPEIKDIVQGKNAPLESQNIGNLYNGYHTTNSYYPSGGSCSFTSSHNVNGNHNLYLNSTDSCQKFTNSNHGSPNSNKRVSFCDEVTVAQIHVD